VTHRIENAPNVDVEDAAVFGLGDLIQWAYPLHTGVVKGDVEPAERFNRKINHPFHVRVFRHVGADECRLTAECFNFSDDLRPFFFAAAGEDDFCTSASEFDRGGLANTGCSSVTSATLPENVLLFMELAFVGCDF
jgi:hypothetical protein